MLLWPSRNEEEFPLMVNIHQNTSAAFHLLNIPLQGTITHPQKKGFRDDVSRNIGEIC